MAQDIFHARLARLPAAPAGQSADPPGRPYPPPGMGESPWPAQLTVLAAICLQLALPKRLTVGPAWLVPALEAALLIGMFVATPRQLEHEHRRRRRVALGLTAFVSAANVYSLGALTHYLLHHEVSNGRALIGSGVLIWLTNWLIFALSYWELDRGGPGVRAAGHDGPPDFLFPQISRRPHPSAELAAVVRRLPVRVTDERGGVLPDGHDAAERDGQVRDGPAVDRFDRDDRTDRLARGEHPGRRDGPSAADEGSGPHAALPWNR